MINIYIFLHLLIALLNFGFCFLILRYSSRKLYHLFLSGIAFFSGIYALLIFLAYVTGNSIWGRLTHIGYFTPFFFVLFILTFKNTKHLIIKALFYFIPLPILLYLALFTNLVIYNLDVTVFPSTSSTGPLDFLGRIYLLILLSVGIINLIKTYKRSEGFQKIQLKYFLLGVIIYILIGTVTVGILPLIIPEKPIVSFITEFASFASIFWVGLSAYAVLRYRLMDIRIFIGRGAIYLFSLVTVLTPAFLLIFMVNQLLTPFSVSVANTLVLIMSILLFQPILQFYERISAKYFYPSFYNTQIVLRDLGKKLIQTVDLDEVVSLITSTLGETIKIDKISLAFKQPTSEFFQFQGSVGFDDKNLASLIRDTFLCSYLLRTKNILVQEELSSMRESTPDEAEKRNIAFLDEKLRINSVKLILPLIQKSNTIGILFFGEKLSANPYSKEDIDLLNNISYQMAISLQNALLYEEIIKDKEVLERFYKLTVGREVKMAELKEKIRELEGKDRNHQ